MSLSTLNPTASLSFFDLISAQTAQPQQQQQQQQRSVPSSRSDEQITDGQDDTERLSIDTYLRCLSAILIARQVAQQYEQSSLSVAARLSQRIASTSSPFNAAYVVRERKRQLQLMEEEMDRTQAVIEKEKENMKQRRAALVQQTEQLKQQVTALASLQQLVMPSHRHDMQQLASSRSLLSLKLRLRRRKMVEQLLTVYPLHVVPANRRPPTDDLSVEAFMIRGIRIPNSHLYQYEEQAATAFSYVAHLTLLLASLYSVTLRYRLVHRSSRSYVWDDAVSGSQFPLFWKGVERDRFETAVALLNKDIEQLRTQVLERGEGYGLQQAAIAMPGQAAAHGGGGGGGGAAGHIIAGGGGGAAGGGGGGEQDSLFKGRVGHGTLDNLKALLDILLPNDDN
jgi:hypothetical protein